MEGNITKMKIVTADEMRRIDRITIEERSIPGLTLMERAGAAVAEVVQEYLEPTRVAVVTGKGNNAGDGFVVARLLHEKGIAVKALLLADPDEFTRDALLTYQSLPDNVVCQRIQDVPTLKELIQDADCLVDAILGTGVKGPVTGFLAEAIQAINEAEKRVVSVDIPSGMQADETWSGGACITAYHTVTMGLPKISMVIHPGIEYAGRVTVASLGFPPDLLNAKDIHNNLVTADFVKRCLPPRPANSNKKTFGYLLIVAGSVGMTGAAVLAARAAARSGAGLVYAAVPEKLNAIFESLLIDEITIPLQCSTGLFLDSKSLDRILEFQERVDAIALGPGIGRETETQRLVCELVARLEKPLAIDADGLNALAGNLDVLLKRKHPTVLTPHPGEMARLQNTTPAEVQRQRIQSARSFASKWGVHIILKGARSVIADPSGELYVNPTGNSGMAKGGSGDVLTGLLVGFLAQGMNALESAVCAAYVHGFAGDLAARAIGERAMIPSDLLSHISSAFRALQGS